MSTNIGLIFVSLNESIKLRSVRRTVTIGKNFLRKIQIVEYEFKSFHCKGMNNNASDFNQRRV